MNEVAVDTNILLYAFDDRFPEKKDRAHALILSKPCFSSQSLSEYINVCLKRLKIPKTDTIELCRFFLIACTLIPVTEKITELAFLIIEKYDLQIFDALIVSSAIEAGCPVLYSEDMQHGLVINNTLTILNPFI
jgi:predicted nucleic acid-binding protein